MARKLCTLGDYKGRGQGGRLKIKLRLLHPLLVYFRSELLKEGLL